MKLKKIVPAMVKILMAIVFTVCAVTISAVDVNSPLTLTTQAASSKTFTVKFNSNGGTGTMDKETFTYGKSKKLTVNKFKRSGYGFVGWNTFKQPLIVEQYVNFMISIAADNSHGYCNDWKYGGNQGPDYDCGSFVSYALQNVGVFGANEWYEPNSESSSYTSDLGQHLIVHGFMQIPYTGEADLQKGDILIMDSTKADGHVEVYAGNGNLVGAHWHYDNTDAGDQEGNEISVGAFTDGSPWLNVYRLADYSSSTGKAAEYADGEAVKNLTSKNKGTVTLYAQWVKKEEFNVQYIIPSDISGMKSSTVIKKAGVPLTLKSTSKLSKASLKSKITTIFNANGGLTSTAPEPVTSKISTVYKISGWSESEKASVPSYDSKEQYIEDCDIVLYPVVNSSKKYASIKITTDIPVRSGYIFLGWSTDKNAKTAEYQPGSIYKTRKNSTLYAVWKPSSYVTLTDGTELLWKEAIKKNYISVNDGVLAGGENKEFIQEIVVDKNITDIDGSAFYKCSNLENVKFEINSKLKRIGCFAFKYCSKLTEIEIPASVTKIETGVFAGCRNISSISVNEGNTVYDSREKCNAVIETKTNTLVAGCKNTVIPDDIIIIGRQAFSFCYELNQLELPQSLISINEYAFIGCSHLTSVEIPLNVTYVGTGAFKNCTNLLVAKVPAAVEIGKEAFPATTMVTYYKA